MKLLKTKMIPLIIIFEIIINIFYINPVFADDIDEDINDIKDSFENNEIIAEASNNIEKDPVLNSRRYVVLDRESKMVIYGKNADVKAAMASTTKIMTATIVLEKCEDLSTTVTISAKAGGTGGSRLGLKKGDKITVYDLLYGLLLRSGNDAAVALAEYMGGSVDSFAELMNEKAKELNLKNTHFVTPHGLDDPNHYTTAEELAKLTDYALNNKKFANIVGTKQYTITINGYSKALNNTNELLGVLDGVVGVKTGFTNGAGRCLVTEVKRGNIDLIIVVLGADTKKDRTKDSVKLINFAFENFEKVNINEVAKDTFDNWNQINCKRIILKKSKYNNLYLKLSDIEIKNIMVRKSEINNIKYEINSITEIETPIEKNTKIGTLSIKLNNNIIQNADIMCDRYVEKKNYWDYFLENYCSIVTRKY